MREENTARAPPPPLSAAFASRVARFKYIGDANEAWRNPPSCAARLRLATTFVACMPAESMTDTAPPSRAAELSRNEHPSEKRKPELGPEAKAAPPLP